MHGMQERVLHEGVAARERIPCVGRYVFNRLHYTDDCVAAHITPRLRTGGYTTAPASMELLPLANIVAELAVVFRPPM
jgi:hypothetical protein